MYWEHRKDLCCGKIVQGIFKFKLNLNVRYLSYCVLLSLRRNNVKFHAIPATQQLLRNGMQLNMNTPRIRNIALKR